MGFIFVRSVLNTEKSAYWQNYILKQRFKLEGFRIIAKLTNRFQRGVANRQTLPVFRAMRHLLEYLIGTKVAKSLQLPVADTLDS
jgi:hypothetical protein